MATKNLRYLLVLAILALAFAGMVRGANPYTKSSGIMFAFDQNFATYVKQMSKQHREVRVDIPMKGTQIDGERVADQSK